MRIGTVRLEEAKVFDTHAGYHRFHSEPRNTETLEGREPYGSFEVYWQDAPCKCRHCEKCETEYQPEGGWYWRARFPGCLPDGEPVGPFAHSRQALHDADEWNPEFD